MYNNAISGVVVSEAYRKLAASVVLDALSSLACEGTTNKTHLAIISLYRSGQNMSEVARTLNLSLSSVRVVVERMGPDPRGFLRSQSPFIEHCGITAGSIRRLVERIDNDPDEAVKVLKEIRRWSRMLSPSVGGSIEAGPRADQSVAVS